MALLFFDGFDHYYPEPTARKKWDDLSYYTYNASGRFGGLAANPSGSGNIFTPTWTGMRKRFTASSTVVLGAAFKWTNYASAVHPFIAFCRSGIPVVQVWVDPSSGELRFYKANQSDLLHPSVEYGDAPSGYVPPFGLWHYMEIKVTAGAGTAGSLLVNVDSTPLLSYTGIATSTDGSIDEIRFMGIENFTSGYIIDDVYILNTTGDAPDNDFLGEVRVQCEYPDAEGYRNDFYPASGSNNSLMVNTTPSTWTDNGKYVYAGVLNAIDSYSIQNFTVAGTIFGVQANVIHRKDDVGNRRVAPICRVNDTTYVGTDAPEYSDYTWVGTIWEKNPNTDEAWGLTDLNQAEFGVKITA